jgi:uncharacterized small protein (DUF1192 family)
MAIDPEELLPRKPKQDIVIGEDISTLSVAELEKRITVFETEIGRAHEAIQARLATKSAADTFFKR